MKDTRKRSGKCEGSNLSNTRNETNIQTGNTFCIRIAEKSRTGLSKTRINFIDEGFTNADERVTNFEKMHYQSDKTYENNLHQLTCDDNYAKSLILHPTILHARKNKQVCHRCKNCTEQQILTRISKTSSINVSESITNDNRHRRTLHLRHKLPDWVKAIALLFIVFLSSCNALPANRDSRRKSAVSTEPDIDNEDTTVLSNGTGLSRTGRSSDFSQHSGVQRLYNNIYGYYLEVRRNGKVIGTRNGDSPYIDMEFKSLATGLVALYFTKSGRFLAVNKKRLSSAINYTHECCAFKESYDPSNTYFTYELASSKSKKSRKRHRYIAIRFKKRKAKKCKTVTLTRPHKVALFTKMKGK